MGAMGLVQREWQAYRTGVIPEDAPPVQVQECRRAFYGAWALLQALMRDLEPGAEERRFNEDVQAGRA